MNNLRELYSIIGAISVVGAMVCFAWMTSRTNKSFNTNHAIPKFAVAIVVSAAIGVALIAVIFKVLTAVTPLPQLNNLSVSTQTQAQHK